ncbi:nitroreductase family protein [Streptomyces sp. NBC_00057]|uniref:nitroreductase family protein n=1 Tax=Streptomyces sp. NBC_00057 TaxID=2975634 RepID=UPI003249063F
MTPGLRDGLSLITSRHCTRGFLDRVVPRDVLAEVLLAAGPAPSSRNTQMWQVTGSALEALVAALCESFDRGDPPGPDYAHRPPSLDDAVERRAGHAASGVLLAKGHAASDHAAARTHLRDNLRFLGIDADRLVVCTPAVGYADETAPVNRFVPRRAGLEEYVQWRN